MVVLNSIAATRHAPLKSLRPFLPGARLAASLIVKQLLAYCDARGYAYIDQLTVADMD